MIIKVKNLKTFYNKIFVGYNCISSQIIFSKLPKWQFSKITISAYVNLLRVIDHKIKNPSIRTKHNLLSSNQSKVTTVGYGGGRVSVPSFISSPVKSHECSRLENTMKTMNNLEFPKKPFEWFLREVVFATSWI